MPQYLLLHVLLTSRSCNPKHSSIFDPDPRDSQKLDQAVVCAETRGPAHLQNPQKWPVGGNSTAQCLRAHREALKEGRLLLQALSPTRAVHLGCQGGNPQ